MLVTTLVRKNHEYGTARRVLERIADRVGRANTRGRPWLWRLKPEEKSGDEKQ